MAAPAALSFQHVVKTYAYSHLGRTTYTRGIEQLDLEISAGEAFGLLGLNGSGKTTTFKLALGLLRPTSGQVRVLGHDPWSNRADGRIGYLPELPYFYPFLTPVESLRFYGGLSGLKGKALDERVDHALRETGLTPLRERRIGQLSKGLTQRVGLAQAILHDPQVIILDEPVSGLDPLAIKQFRESLTRLKQQGKTLLVSSHSISEIEKLCDRVGILKDGRMVRVAIQAEWARADGGLEGLFVETVR
jgi:ABC-2 type transport system ATP-binding protein